MITQDQIIITCNSCGNQYQAYKTIRIPPCPNCGKENRFLEVKDVAGFIDRIREIQQIRTKVDHWAAGGLVAGSFLTLFVQLSFGCKAGVTMFISWLVSFVFMGASLTVVWQTIEKVIEKFQYPEDK
jgi:hypothetical protein